MVDFERRRVAQTAGPCDKELPMGSRMFGKPSGPAGRLLNRKCARMGNFWRKFGKRVAHRETRTRYAASHETMRSADRQIIPIVAEMTTTGFFVPLNQMFFDKTVTWSLSQKGHP